MKFCRFLSKICPGLLACIYVLCFTIAINFVCLLVLFHITRKLRHCLFVFSWQLVSGSLILIIVFKTWKGTTIYERYFQWCDWSHSPKYSSQTLALWKMGDNQCGANTSYEKRETVLSTFEGQQCVVVSDSTEGLLYVSFCNDEVVIHMVQRYNTCWKPFRWSSGSIL